MSSERTDIPAFPVITDQVSNIGMTLRDYFAAGIMASIMGAGENLGQATDIQLDMIFDEAARVVYRCADAMMRERAK